MALKVKRNNASFKGFDPVEQEKILAKPVSRSRSRSNKNISPALKKIVKEMLQNIKENKPNIEIEFPINEEVSENTMKVLFEMFGNNKHTPERLAFLKEVMSIYNKVISNVDETKTPKLYKYLNKSVIYQKVNYSFKFNNLNPSTQEKIIEEASKSLNEADLKTLDKLFSTTKVNYGKEWKKYFGGGPENKPSETLLQKFKNKLKIASVVTSIIGYSTLYTLACVGNVATKITAGAFHIAFWGVDWINELSTDYDYWRSNIGDKIPALKKELQYLTEDEPEVLRDAMEKANPELSSVDILKLIPNRTREQIFEAYTPLEREQIEYIFKKKLQDIFDKIFRETRDSDNRAVLYTNDDDPYRLDLDDIDSLVKNIKKIINNEYYRHSRSRHLGFKSYDYSTYIRYPKKIIDVTITEVNIKTYIESYDKDVKTYRRNKEVTRNHEKINKIVNNVIDKILKKIITLENTESESNIENARKTINEIIADNIDEEFHKSINGISINDIIDKVLEQHLSTIVRKLSIEKIDAKIIETPEIINENEENTCNEILNVIKEELKQLKLFTDEQVTKIFDSSYNGRYKIKDKIDDVKRQLLASETARLRVLEQERLHEIADSNRRNRELARTLQYKEIEEFLMIQPPEQEAKKIVLIEYDHLQNYKNDDCTCCLSEFNIDPKSEDTNKLPLCVLHCKHVLHMQCMCNWVKACKNTERYGKLFQTYDLKCPACNDPIDKITVKDYFENCNTDNINIKLLETFKTTVKPKSRSSSARSVSKESLSRRSNSARSVSHESIHEQDEVTLPGTLMRSVSAPNSQSNGYVYPQMVTRVMSDISHVSQPVVRNSSRRNRGHNVVDPAQPLQPLVNNFTPPEPPATTTQPVATFNPYEDRVTTPPQATRQPVRRVVPRNPQNRTRVMPVLGGKKESKRRIKSA